MDAAAEIGRNPVSKHQIQRQNGDEQADAGRDGTAELVSRGTGEYSFFPVQLTTSRIGNLTRLIHTQLYVMTIHAYIHTCILLSFIVTILYPLNYVPHSVLCFIMFGGSVW